MIQTVEQTHEEKITMYMKYNKKELIEMLINCNLMLENVRESYAEKFSNDDDGGHDPCYG